MQFTQQIQGELPFTLNVPSGTYKVNLDGSSYILELLQDRIAVAVNAQEMAVGTVETLRGELGERWDNAFKHDLHTIVRYTDEVNVTLDQMVRPTDDDLFSAQTSILRDSRDYSGDLHQLHAHARASLDAMTAEVRQAFVEDTTIRMTADRLFSRNDSRTFCKAVNTLVRLYMTTFGDFFVEEVLPQHFSNTAYRGILVSCYYNRVRLHRCRDAGGRFPFILRRRWLTHSEQDIQRFQESLENGSPPDPVKLLGIRARAFLMRGGYRSAINEASAALDLCLTRKIRAGLGSQGKATQEIDTILRSNVWFAERAKKILKDAVGKSAAELDPSLWEKVMEHRKQRQGVAHADVEPGGTEATAAVEDTLKLLEKIEAI
jgi:hypothetical protein